MSYHRSVIVDVHTHLFPPDLISERDAYLAADATFAELYGSPNAKLATAELLIESMEAARVDVSVALGFAWTDADSCRRHNDYLLDAAARSAGRIVAFCSLPLAAGIWAVESEARRCVEGGARGFGELRPDNLGFDLKGDGGRLLATLAQELKVALLFHASEPVGHAYPGKQGLAVQELYEFILKYPDANMIAAHWGGGLPFYALMPEVKVALQHVSFDTAGTSLLYSPDIYERATGLVGAGSIVFGSDFPLLSQARSRERIERSGLDTEALDLVLGENARKLLDLE
jgi:predicted TIM-barrel fold metal-dependent hydrolase